jgi:hypothetical protein
MPLVLAGDFALVTNNSKEFRGKTPGQGAGLHAEEEIHAGLVCLNAELGMDIDKQRQLFEIALEELTSVAGLVNQAIEVTEREDGSVEVVFCAIPADGRRCG